MKRNISFIIVLSIILSLFSFPAVAEYISPTVDLTYTNPNNVCTVTAKLKNIAKPFRAVEVILDYDSTVLSYISHTKILSSNMPIQEYSNNENGRLSLGWATNPQKLEDSNGLIPTANQDIILCKISFNVLKSAPNNKIFVSSQSSVIVANIDFEKDEAGNVIINEKGEKNAQISYDTSYIPAIQIPINVVYTAPVTDSPSGPGPSGPGPNTPVVPVATPTPENTFIDLGGYDWASQSIYKLSKLGIIKGTSDNTFSPANNITRADFAVLLSRTFNLKGEVTGNFDDVPAGEYFYQPIGILKSLDIAKGSEGKYKPYESITRQDIIVLTHRALTLLGNIKDSPDYDILNKFEDKGSISNYATESVCIMISRGIIKGNDGQLAPLNNATRAEAAVIFDRIYNILPK